MKEKQEKQTRGRKPQNKASRAYTLDKEIVEFINSLEENTRSKFVNDWLRQHPQIQEALNREK